MNLQHTKHMILIDGYNALHKIPSLEKHKTAPLRRQREELALYISNWKQKIKCKGMIQIIFDGQRSKTKGMLGRNEILHGITCSYSKHKQEADDMILDFVRTANDPKMIYVVSDDNFVANNVRALGAHIRAVSFLQTDKGVRGARNKEEDNTKKIAPHTARAITNDMKKIWGVT